MPSTSQTYTRDGPTGLQEGIAFAAEVGFDSILERGQAVAEETR